MRYEVKESYGSAKSSIANKEARETSYWLRLSYASKYLTERQFASLHADFDRFSSRKKRHEGTNYQPKRVE
ncbi:MAG: four helix bundle protein [Lentisphaeria bacterium]|nr:four helix bundle protein [Lentisphaeria bacterium]